MFMFGNELVTVACLKWGTLYGPEFVNNLYAMVRRNLTIPFRFVCFTDDPSGLHKDIVTYPIGNYFKGWWGKLHYFKRPLFDITGPVLAIDLDMVIIKNIDCMFTHMPGEFLMKWDIPGHGHSSCVMRFDANQYPHIVDEFNLTDDQYSLDNSQPNFKAKRFWGDQLWITHQMEQDPKGRKVQLFPKNWVHIYQLSGVYPEDTKIVAFAGITGRNDNPRYFPQIAPHWHSNDLPKD